MNYETYDAAMKASKSYRCLLHPDNIPVALMMHGSREYRLGCAGCRREGTEPQFRKQRTKESHGN